MLADLKTDAIFDLAIVGGGPAGISAALEAYRYELNLVLIERSCLGGSLRLARRVDNYPPWPPGKGLVLAELFRKRFLESGLPFLSDEVIELRIPDKDKNCYGLVMKKAGTIRARTVILATGKEFYVPDDLGFLEKYSFLPGELEPKFVDETNNLAVVGGGEVALDQALFFYDCGARVTLLARSTLKANPMLLKECWGNIEILLNVKPTSALKLNNDRIGLRWISACGNEESGEFNWIVVACGKKPCYPKLVGLNGRNPLNTEGKLSVESGIPGLFLAGDLKNGSNRYVSFAVTDGMRAAQIAKKYLDEWR